MNTLEKLSDRSAPFTSPIKVKIVARSQQMTSKAGNTYMTMSMADSTGIKKAVLYDVSLADKMEEGKSILLRNYTVSNGSVMVNTKSKVSNTSEVMVDRERERQAREIIYPPTSPFVNIKEALVMPVGSMLSTKGLIVEEAMVKVVMGDVPIKEITIEEDGKKMIVSLWRQHSANEEVAIGKFVQIENIAIKKFNGSNVGNTTARTKIIIDVSPPEKTHMCEVIGYEKEEECLVLNCLEAENVIDIKVARAILEICFGEDATPEDVLDRTMPIMVNITEVSGVATDIVQI
ncbi:uncharacterized protein LOC143078875 [Mytilus galloprovincialis]|uniref:Uncharacterized protein n=1 Tax=Mytilus galloprovincialis TaxID=29158 RepID=A0A8B6CFC2_MYTGA|nr:Hypothetical predicted protein [Mytilus galloprovincialis]